MKALSFYFRSKKRELKNLVSIKSFGSLKMGYRFSIFAQEILTAKLWENFFCVHTCIWKINVFSLFKLFLCTYLHMENKRFQDSAKTFSP